MGNRQTSARRGAQLRSIGAPEGFHNVRQSTSMWARGYFAVRSPFFVPSVCEGTSDARRARNSSTDLFSRKNRMNRASFSVLSLFLLAGCAPKITSAVADQRDTADGGDVVGHLVVHTTSGADVDAKGEKITAYGAKADGSGTADFEFSLKDVPEGKVTLEVRSMRSGIFSPSSSIKIDFERKPSISRVFDDATKKWSLVCSNQRCSGGIQLDEKAAVARTTIASLPAGAKLVSPPNGAAAAGGLSATTPLLASLATSPLSKLPLRASYRVPLDLTFADGVELKKEFVFPAVEVGEADKFDVVKAIDVSVHDPSLAAAVFDGSQPDAPGTFLVVRNDIVPSPKLERRGADVPLGKLTRVVFVSDDKPAEVAASTRARTGFAPLSPWVRSPRSSPLSIQGLERRSRIRSSSRRTRRRRVRRR